MISSVLAQLRRHAGCAASEDVLQARRHLAPPGPSATWPTSAAAALQRRRWGQHHQWRLVCAASSSNGSSGNGAGAGAQGRNRRLTILHFNDVYNIEQRGIEPVGGAARFMGAVRRHRDSAAAAAQHPPLVLFSGDCLNPSLMSAFTRGEQMVPVLNCIGVHAAAVGNHDFDFGVATLQKHMREGFRFPWLLSNVLDARTGRPLGGAERSRIVEWQGVRVGLMGLVEKESFAWSTSLKQKLACGSVVMTPIMEYYEFFGRELQPGVHYIEVAHTAGDMCDDISRNVHAMNAWLDQHASEGQESVASPAAENAAEVTAAQGDGGVIEEASARRLLLNGDAAQLAADGELLEQGGSQHGRRLLGVWGYPPKKARDSYSNPWDSDLTPIEIARNGRQFLLDHVRMRDARLYIRDLLIQYGKRLRFTPTPQPGSVRYTGNKLLQNVAIPHRVDAFHLASQYPWLTYWGE